jgi:hypothetical protein
MKKYSIFFEEDNNYYPVLFADNKYWLGGSKCEYLLFSNKMAAETTLNKIRKQDKLFFNKGTLAVHLFSIIPIIR